MPIYLLNCHINNIQETLVVGKKFMHTKIPKPKVFPERFFLKNHNLINALLFFEEKNEKYGFQKTSQSQRHL